MDQPCQICFDDESTELVFHPCPCKYVHKSCMKRWLETTENEQYTKQCEICHHEYDIENDVFVEYKLRILTSLITITFLTCLILVQCLALFLIDYIQNDHKRYETFRMIRVVIHIELMVFLVVVQMPNVQLPNENKLKLRNFIFFAWVRIWWVILYLLIMLPILLNGILILSALLSYEITYWMVNKKVKECCDFDLLQIKDYEKDFV